MQLKIEDFKYFPVDLYLLLYRKNSNCKGTNNLWTKYHYVSFLFFISIISDKENKYICETKDTRIYISTCQIYTMTARSKVPSWSIFL